MVENAAHISLNSSKSMLIRQLILSFLYGRKMEEICPDDSEDVKVVHHLLSIINQDFTDNETVTLDVRDCGAAYRFLMAVAAVTPGRWHLTGTPRLLTRPIRPLVDALQQMGAEIAPADDGWNIVGHPLHAKRVSIDCTESSQLASALLLIQQRVGLAEVEILPAAPPSAPYIELTRRMANAYQQGKTVPREGDWSTAAFWYGYLLARKDLTSLTLNNLHLNSWQGDRVTSEWFRSFGVESEQQSDGVLIRKVDVGNSTAPLTFNLTNHPDLAPVLAATALLCGRRATLHGLASLNSKESRRLDLLSEVLGHFAKVEVGGNDTLEIFVNQKDSESETLYFDTHNDHRIVMFLTLLSTRYNIHFSGSQSVKKSYPDFEKYFPTRA